MENLSKFKEPVRKRLADFTGQSFAQPSYDSEPSLISRQRMADGW